MNSQTQVLVSDEVSVDVAAPPDRVWSLVSDVTRMKEWSQMCTGCEWLGGSTEPKVGNRFVGYSRVRGTRTSRQCVITASEPGRVFAFDTLFRGKVSNHWRYRIEAIPQGTCITESYEVILMPRWVKTLRLIPGMADRSRRDVKRDMLMTLNRIKASAESAPA